MEQILFGIDLLLADPGEWKNGRLGLVTNNAATTSSGEASRGALLRNGYNLVRLFSPEHGLSTKGADGVAQPGEVDPLTGLQVVSLYGDHFRPSMEELADLDLVLFDIPDAGCRFYTYLWTLTHVMEACAAAGKKLIVLDRPNPLSGDLFKAEGPMLDEKNCASLSAAGIFPYDIVVRWVNWPCISTPPAYQDLTLKLSKCSTGTGNKRLTSVDGSLYPLPRPYAIPLPSPFTRLPVFSKG